MDTNVFLYIINLGYIQWNFSPRISQKGMYPCRYPYIPGEWFRYNQWTVCPFDKKDHDRKTKALETFFILQYDGVGKGYNATYNYPSVERAHEIVEGNAEYIIRCLKNNGIRFRLEIQL